MRRLFAASLAASVLMSFSVLAADFTSLKGQIGGYSNLSNTPPAPAIEFTSKNGETITLEKYKGKTVVLNLWATWCPPCIREMPGLNNLAKEFKDKNLVVLAVASGRQGREEPDAFLENRELTDIISYHDKDQNFLRLMDINTLPVTFVIDPEGKMRGGVIGMSEWDTPKAIEALKAVVK